MSDLDAARAIVQSFRYDDHGGYDANMEWLQHAIAAALRAERGKVWNKIITHLDNDKNDHDGFTTLCKILQWCEQQAKEEG